MASCWLRFLMRLRVPYRRHWRIWCRLCNDGNGRTLPLSGRKGIEHFRNWTIAFNITFEFTTFLDFRDLLLILALDVSMKYRDFSKPTSIGNQGKGNITNLIDILRGLVQLQEEGTTRILIPTVDCGNFQQVCPGKNACSWIFYACTASGTDTETAHRVQYLNNWQIAPQLLKLCKFNWNQKRFLTKKPIAWWKRKSNKRHEKVWNRRKTIRINGDSNMFKKSFNGYPTLFDERESAWKNTKFKWKSWTQWSNTKFQSE